jgi:geranylgeranyl diphosphate synthase type II
MDDDALRRGRPTTHRRFGEGMAILAGDALLTEAFRVMATGSTANGMAADRVVAAVKELAVAAGMRGMVGGQVADLEHEGRRVGLATVRSIHLRKTGALIEAAARAGGLVGGADARAIHALSRYGRALGLALQIADDVRDAEASTAVTGKVTRRDRALGKATYTAVLGTARARAELARQVDRAARALGPIGRRGVLLRELVRQVAEWGAAGVPERHGRVSRAARQGGQRQSRRVAASRPGVRRRGARGR